MTVAGDRSRVRRCYDTIASTYAERLGDELTYKPLDRALLAAVIEEAGPSGPIADLGCGPGHVAGWLHSRGARAVGIDLSPEMVAQARRRHPEVEYRVGDLVDLPASDGEFAGVVALYSIIHLTPGDRSRALEEMRRVVRPGGPVLVAFHIGEEVRHLEEWWGHEVDIEGWYMCPEEIAAQMLEAGLAVRATIERANHAQEVETRRAYLLAYRQDRNDVAS